MLYEKLTDDAECSMKEHGAVKSLVIAKGLSLEWTQILYRGTLLSVLMCNSEIMM